MNAPLLHVANGDSTALTLREGAIPGRVVNWADALTDGPVPAVTPDELRAVRARFWSGLGISAGTQSASGDAPSVHELWDRDLASFADDDEVVIWCEHDLYDQLLLLHHLHAFATGRRPRALSLVCIDSFPGVARFIGLGQLDAEQLASLFPRRVPVTEKQLSLASEGWQAFTSDDPVALERFAASDLTCLPFLSRALHELIAEYPSVGDGLPRTERRLLDLLAGGAATFDALFSAWQAAEPAPTYGDSSIWWRLRDLASGPRPLVVIEDARPESETPAAITITDDGRRALRGELDWLAVDPFDRWIGGVHLASPRAWRWDSARRRLLRPPG